MRLAPKSLAGQLTLLLLLALAVAQGVAVALFAWERMEALRDAHRDDAVLRTATVARLLGDTPPGLHDSVIAAASTELARFSLTAEPVMGETGTGEGAAAKALIAAKDSPSSSISSQSIDRCERSSSMASPGDQSAKSASFMRVLGRSGVSLTAISRAWSW